jgi:transglutaminase-like putative cysteine protease
MPHELGRRNVQERSVRAAATGQDAAGEDTRARTSVILLLAFWIATLGLHVLLTDLAWWLVVCLVVTAVLGAPAAIRAWVAWRAAPTIAAIGALVVMLTLFFAPGTAFLAVVPTWETLGRFGSLISEAVTSVNHQSVPADPNTAIVFLLCAGVGAMAVLADLLAISAGRPALAGVPLLVILAVPAITASGLTDLVIFLLVAAMYLWLLQRRGRVQQLRYSLALGAGMLAATLALPVLLPAVAESPSVGGRGGGFAAGINPVVNLGDDLRRGAIQTALTYTTDSGQGNYLRLVSLQNFSGDGWTPDKVSVDEDNTTRKFGPPPGLFGDVESTVDRTHVVVDQLDSPWLPVPYPSVKITGLDGDWFWEKDALTVSSPDRSTWGEDYTVDSLVLAPTPVQLTTAGTSVPAGFERYLQLPEGMPEIIPSTARKVASSAASNYEKALALQEFFRHGDFEYSESAPVQQGYDGSGMEVIAKFLEVKQGYCIHFASAMTVMARSIGIPARMAVGFLPGLLTTNRIEGKNVFRVTTHELHTWPELFFEGVGWVRFEPTVSRGEVPDYAIQGSPGVPVPPLPAATDPAPPTTAPRDLQDPGAVAPDDPGASPTDPNAVDTAGVWLAGLGGALLILVLVLIPAMIRAGQRLWCLLRLWRGSGTATDAWNEVLRSAEDLDLPLSGTQTPRETARSLAAAARIDLDGPLVRLLRGVEIQSYARPEGSTLTLDRTTVGVGDALRSIVQLHAHSDARTRIRAALLPRSIWDRMLAPFSRAG